MRVCEGAGTISLSDLTRSGEDEPEPPSLIIYRRDLSVCMCVCVCPCESLGVSVLQ